MLSLNYTICYQILWASVHYNLTYWCLKTNRHALNSSQKHQFPTRTSNVKLNETAAGIGSAHRSRAKLLKCRLDYFLMISRCRVQWLRFNANAVLPVEWVILKTLVISLTCILQWRYLGQIAGLKLHISVSNFKIFFFFTANHLNKRQCNCPQNEALAKPEERKKESKIHQGVGSSTLKEWEVYRYNNEIITNNN